MQLEAKLKEKINTPLAEKVQFTQEQDNFHGYMHSCDAIDSLIYSCPLSLPSSLPPSFLSIISNCVQLLVQDMESACVTAFNSMVKVIRR